MYTGAVAGMYLMFVRQERVSLHLHAAKCFHQAAAAGTGVKIMIYYVYLFPGQIIQI